MDNVLLNFLGENSQSDPQGTTGRRAHYYAVIAQSGLFDFDYYRLASGLAGSPEDLLEHYLDSDPKSGVRPNAYFEVQYYLQRYPDIDAFVIHPFVHFILHGDQEKRWPGPLFNTPWYREKHRIGLTDSALAHYLSRRKDGGVSPIPEFDIEYYAKHCPDVIAAKIDPFEHYIAFGYREGRRPSADFDARWYADRYLNGATEPNPFFHWLAHKGEPGVHGKFPDDEPTVAREIRKFVKAAAEFEDFRPLPKSATRKAKVLAYYLPQFHSFAENDEWWGKGFTEWTNLARGTPRFQGHYQPRIPRDLGFYRLDSNNVKSTLKEQVRLAADSGIHGFVFYHYWFNKRRLMAGPVEHFLQDASIDFPFCLMWANENWTRRWDGAESEVLISQDYRSEDDAEMLADFGRHFKDARYIRIQGRPLFMIYRPGIIPKAAATIARWRTIWNRDHGEDPIIVMAQAFGDTDPNTFGLDGAIEFPPHKLTQSLPPINSDLKILDPEFTGKVYRYETVVSESLSEPTPSFPLIKTAVPSWDNDARRQGSGLVLTGSTPGQYEQWLARLVERANAHRFHGESFVCVNAWNEWCEGAYLEPDVHFGSAYLNATARAVAGIGGTKADSGHRLLLIGHDAFPSGAQRLLLNIGRALKRNHGVNFEYLLLDGGKLVSEYEQLAPTTVLSGGSGLGDAIARFASRGFVNALVNTTAAGLAAAECHEYGLHTVLLVHELPRILMEKGLLEAARKGIRAANRVIFPAEYVRKAVLDELGIAPDEAQHTRIQPQGSYQSITPSAEAAAEFRAKVGIPKDEPMVLGIGYADLRKGFDLFLQVWRRVNERRRVHFCWLGDFDPELRRWLESEIEIGRATGTLHIPGLSNVVPAFSAASAFALTSREDPFPTVALESLEAGVPVVAFKNSGGIPELLDDADLGAAVPYGDVEAMAEAIDRAIESNTTKLRDKRRELVQTRYSFSRYVQTLLHEAIPGLQKVSVVIPNYNYAQYMAERLGSVFKQTYPVHEIIVLDDRSTDDSLNVIRAIANDWGREIRLVPNEVNSGSVFKQWEKASELATGDWVWIAEADDSASEDFLEKSIEIGAADATTRLTFTDSRTVHVDGTPQWDSYKAYYATLHPNAFEKDQRWSGKEFIAQFLGVKNVILNVSSVLWRASALRASLATLSSDLQGYKMAGDWRLYIDALNKPEASVGYKADALNVHRRHSSSVTHQLQIDAHLDEIKRCQRHARESMQGRADSTDLAKRQKTYLAGVRKELKSRNH